MIIVHLYIDSEEVLVVILFIYAQACDTYHSHRATYVRLCPVIPINLAQEITEVYS